MLYAYCDAEAFSLLVVIPPALSGRLGAALSALIVVLCAVALTLHKDFYAGVKRKDFLVYFTNLSCILVLVYFALLAPRLYGAAALRFLIPHAEFFVTANIMLTCIVFHTMLMPGLIGKLQSFCRQDAAMLLANNLLIHYAVPLLTLAYWLLCAPGKQALGAADAVVWMLFPAVYALWILRRSSHPRRKAGSERAECPYPFLDVRAFGKRRVALSCAAIFATGSTAAILTLTAVWGLFHLFGAGHILFLI